MPFLGDKLRELRKREQLSRGRFGRLFGDFIHESNIGGKDSFTERQIYRWENDSAGIPVKYIDAVYLFARSRGHGDLDFYSPPKADATGI